jgi:hypothetical protein
VRKEKGRWEGGRRKAEDARRKAEGRTLNAKAMDREAGTGKTEPGRAEPGRVEPGRAKPGRAEPGKTGKRTSGDLLHANEAVSDVLPKKLDNGALSVLPFFFHLVHVRASTINTKKKTSP